MVWKEIDESIVELEKDFLGLIQEIENKDLISKETLHLQEENKKIMKQIEDLSKENEILTSELNKEIQLHENLKRNYDTLQDCILKKETACMNFQAAMEVNDRDDLRLKKAKEQYQIGKELTRIRWDYAAPQHLCKGHIVNASKKSIDTFALDKNKYSEDQIQEYLWALIEKHSSVNWNDLVALCADDKVDNKENKKINK